MLSFVWNKNTPVLSKLIGMTHSLLYNQLIAVMLEVVYNRLGFMMN